MARFLKGCTLVNVYADLPRKDIRLLTGEISAFIVEPKGELNNERLLMALNLILSEKDVTDFFEFRETSFRTAQKGISKKRKANSL